MAILMYVQVWDFMRDTRSFRGFFSLHGAVLSGTRQLPLKSFSWVLVYIKKLPENKRSFSDSLYHAIDFVSILLQRINILHIIDHHERNLKGQRIIKLSDIQPGRLVEFLDSVDEGIAVHIELARCL